MQTDETGPSDDITKTMKLETDLSVSSGFFDLNTRAVVEYVVFDGMILT